MLKLLLVGFTAQNANVIQMFIELTFDNIRVSAVPRLPESTTPRMPDLTVFESESDMFIMDAEHIGFDFSNYHKACQSVATTLPDKPILMVSRQALPAEAGQLTANFQWLTVPYTRTQMADKLQLLISDAKLKQTQKTANVPVMEVSLAANVSSSASAPVSPAMSKSEPSAITTVNEAEIEQSNAIFDLLNKTFNQLGESAFFEFAQTLYQLQQPTLFNVNGHFLYVNPLDNSVVASRLERIIDHFMIGQNLRQSLATRQSLDQASYEQQTQQHILAGDKKMTLAQLIWHIGLEMLPRNSFDGTHNLPIEVRLMPNLTGIGFVPNYVMPLIASCLGRVRTLADFHQLFPNLTNAQVNQVLILLIMSHSVNTQLLLAQRSVTSQPTSAPAVSQSTQQATATVENKGIQKAQQTGFLKRLLGKLGVNI